MLKGKHIIIGITGGIAAYKAAVLVRLLVREGAEVQVLMTRAAKEFITPLTMATLSKRPILVENFNPENGAWNSHIDLGCWADAMVIAPATANTLAKMACGIGDSLLLTTYLSARCPIAVAPAMDLDMMAHQATQQNLDTLKQRGVMIIEAESGELASGLSGKGRMAEPEVIVESIRQLLGRKQTLAGRRAMVTAGATMEAIDPVRYITNHSTGKMGYAIAAELAARGAEVRLVSGRTQLPCPKGVERVDVVSAEDMFRACCAEWDGADIGVMCAAVADYTPEQVSPTKIKKSDDDMCIRLRRTPDIAAELGRRKEGRVLVGFALETDNEQVNAQQKLERKNLDFVVLNSLRDKGACFGGDTNKVCLIDRQGEQSFPLESKARVAERIVDKIEEILKTK
ncbi:MAG: bifunctional phosphopantothenoylcysteine decarboxylase/phosphopantothenate--cysteine ligase CoaBC [Rikenellaceae bacterium]|nr:bifunctional phosphopantothenoylcysteine decarboxylase/phosphopantothenate--cysteine ligase CoaBC [Rikenellaceae bacterium]